jgi:membrane fusion protein, multidrug efflux system
MGANQCRARDRFPARRAQDHGTGELSMKKRMVLMLAGVLVFVLVVGGVKFFQIRAAIAAGAAFQPPPEAVTTVVAKQETWSSTLHAIGTANAVQGVVVSADLPGIVERISFESGKKVRAGEVLLQLDARQEEAQLAAAQAQLELTKLNLDRMAGLLGRGVTSKAEHDRAAAEHKTAEARVGEIRATIARKTVRAPFTGVLGIRQVNLGQYLEGGKPIVPLQALDPIHVDFSVPQQDAAPMRAGTEILVTAEGLPSPVKGRITAIDSVVDPATRNVKVQARVANPEGLVRPGMYVTVDVSVGEGRSVVALPATSILNAPYGDSVFIVEDIAGPNGQKYRGARQQFVKVGAGRGDQVAVLDGVAGGAEVVTSGVFKLRNGVAVHVNNDVVPGNNPAPKPEDN